MRSLIQREPEQRQFKWQEQITSSPNSVKSPPFPAAFSLKLRFAMRVLHAHTEGASHLVFYF